MDSKSVLFAHGCGLMKKATTTHYASTFTRLQYFFLIACKDLTLMLSPWTLKEQARKD